MHIRQWQGWLRKEPHCPKNRSSYLLDYWTPLLKSPFDDCLHGRRYFSYSSPVCRDLSTYFFPRCLSYQFSNNALSKSQNVHPIPLTTGDKLVNNHTSGHSSFQTKCMTMYTSWSSAHCEDFLVLVFYRAVLEIDCNAAVVHSLCPNNMENHQKTRS